MVLEGPELAEAVWFNHLQGERKGIELQNLNLKLKPEYWERLGHMCQALVNKKPSKIDPKTFLEMWLDNEFECRKESCPMPHRCVATANTVARKLAIKVIVSADVFLCSF